MKKMTFLSLILALFCFNCIQSTALSKAAPSNGITFTIKAGKVSPPFSYLYLGYSLYHNGAKKSFDAHRDILKKTLHLDIGGHMYLRAKVDEGSYENVLGDKKYFIAKSTPRPKHPPKNEIYNGDTITVVVPGSGCPIGYSIIRHNSIFNGSCLNINQANYKL